MPLRRADSGRSLVWPESAGSVELSGVATVRKRVALPSFSRRRGLARGCGCCLRVSETEFLGYTSGLLSRGAAACQHTGIPLRIGQRLDKGVAVTGFH